VQTPSWSGSAAAVAHVHDALLHDSPDELAAVAVPFVREGLAAGDAVVVATAAGTAELLRQATDGDPRLQVLERSDAYGRRPPAVITAIRRLADALSAEGVSRIRVVGEVGACRTPRDWVEWQRYEAVLDALLAGRPLWGLCVFDRAALPEQVLESALCTHPTVVDGGRRRPSPLYTDPAAYLLGLPLPAEPLEATVPRLAADGVTDPIGLRHAVAAELAAVRGRRRDLVDDFLLAVDETVSNAVRHGRPPVGLRLWTSADRVVCTVTDGGSGIDDPFAGYGPAHGDDLSRGGMGVWLARQLCDHVDVWRSDAGAVVRLTTLLP
jgi:anti-sigma regulatory factor (Ser/Thr protein kinase)